MEKRNLPPLKKKKKVVVHFTGPPGKCQGTSLVVQWLRLRAYSAGGIGSIPGWGNKIPPAVWYSQKKEKEKMWQD